MPRLKNPTPEEAQAIKDYTLNWLKERFEIPDAQWLPGRPGASQQCPVARILNQGGYLSPHITPSSAYYLTMAVRIRNITVKLPKLVGRFVIFFDRGCYPELVEYFGGTLADARKGAPDGPQDQANATSRSGAAATPGALAAGAH